MLGPVANVHHPAPFEMAVADVKVAVVTIDRDAATPEFTAIKGEVVVVELQEGDTPLAILKEAVFESGFRQRLALAAMVFQDGGIGETPKRQMAVRNLGLKTLGGLVMESHAGYPPAIQFQADKSRVRHAIQGQHRPATSAVPNQFRVSPASDDEPPNPPGSRRVLEQKRRGNSVVARGKVEHRTIPHPAQRFLQGDRIIRLPIPNGCRGNVGFDIDPSCSPQAFAG
jgi:hypothetical protein